MKEKIDFKDYLDIASKLEIKSGKIVKVSDVEKSDRLLKLEVDFGEDTTRTVVTNIKNILPETGYVLERNTYLFITNLKPAKMMGIESQAMIMPGEIEKYGLPGIDTKPGNTFM